MTGKQRLTERQHDQKTFVPYILKADAAQGIVDAIVSVFGVIDQGDDVVHPGAFTKTLSERAGKIRVLDNHKANSISDIAGKPLSLREIGREELPVELLAKYPTATGGLLTSTQFYLSTEEDRRIFERVADGQTEWSFGFNIVQHDFGKAVGADGKPVTVRNIREVILYEYSPVLWGMNQATVTVGAKGDQPEPEQLNEYTPEGPMQRCGDYLCGCMLGELHEACDEMLEEGTLDYTEYESVVNLGQRCVGDFRKMMDENVALRPKPEKPDWGMFFANVPEMVGKSGRVLSASNAAKIRDAWNALQEVLNTAGLFDETPADESEDAGEKAGSSPETPTPEGASLMDILRLEVDLLDREFSLLAGG